MSIVAKKFWTSRQKIPTVSCSECFQVAAFRVEASWSVNPICSFKASKKLVLIYWLTGLWIWYDLISMLENPNHN